MYLVGRYSLHAKSKHRKNVSFDILIVVGTMFVSIFHMDISLGWRGRSGGLMWTIFQSNALRYLFFKNFSLSRLKSFTTWLNIDQNSSKCEIPVLIKIGYLRIFRLKKIKVRAVATPDFTSSPMHLL